MNGIFTTSGGGRTEPAAAVFDFDGLIADTSACWHAAYRTALERRGRRLGAEELRALAGASVREAARGLELPADELGIALRRAFATMPLEPLPGVASLLARLRGALPMAVATNGPHDVVCAALRRLGLEASFEAVVSAEALAHEKPAPDVYLEACRRLAVDPARAVAFEDSAIGATAARRAGLFVVHVACGPREQVDADLALERLDDPALLAVLGLAPPREPTLDAARERT